jgi:hypothetical protein
MTDDTVKLQFMVEFTNVWDEQEVTWEVKRSSVRRGIDVSVSDDFDFPPPILSFPSK